LKHFLYSAVTRTGDKLAGEMQAASREQVLEQLHRLGHLPVDVSERGAGAAPAALAKLSVWSRPAGSQVTLFTYELAMLLKAGLPLDRSLDLLAKDSGSAKMARLMRRIHDQISGGKSLQEALEAQTGVFPPVYTSMVRVAETSGTLDTVLARIAAARRRAEKLRSKALSAVLYPALLIVMALGAVIIMLAFVVPRFKEMIVGATAEVPDSARFVIAASDWLIANGQLLALAAGAAILSAALLWMRGTGRGLIEAALLRTPLVGHVIRLNLAIGFCRTLGILLENGVELPTAIKLIRDVVGNRTAAGWLDQSYDSLRKGRGFIEPLDRSGLFPPVMINMLRVGEETGSLTASALHMAEMFEDKLETAVQRTFTIIEPVIILLVSIFIAGVIISILSAVISINDLAI
jgi:type II secretory pathway component PulF